MPARAPETFDVVICGGGLAGLTLARQLRRALPKASLLVLEKFAGPIPDAAFKVGESTVDAGAHYLAEILGLKDYLRKSHLPKFSLRFFMGDAALPLEDRPELGISRFTALPSSFQLDRGLFERDLRSMNKDLGIRMLEGISVNDIKLSKGGAPHEVEYRRAGETGGRTARARWVIDATGRRRLLQAKLGLKLENGHDAGACWFRLEGRVAIDDMVPARRKDWHGRVSGAPRYWSTNHLMGKGYWVWLIPLSTGHTSVGIVADEKIHPFKEYSTYGAARAWLRRHEPRLEAFIGTRPCLDFKRLKGFSYSSKRVFSGDRWACVGEAGFFLDPFYSPGSDFIAFGNSMVTRMIELDLTHGRFDAPTADGFNQVLLAINDNTADIYRNNYPFFGTTQVMTAKLLWDWVVYWGFTANLFFQGLLTRPEFFPRINAAAARLAPLNAQVHRLLREWAAAAPRRDTYGFCDPFRFRLLHSLLPPLLPPLRLKKTPADVFEDIQATLEHLEEFAQAIFLRAVSETAPRLLERLPSPIWVNAWAVTLDASRWTSEEDGLLAPRTAPRDLGPMIRDFAVSLPP